MNKAQKQTVKLWVEALRSGIYVPIERSKNFYSEDFNNCGCGVGVLGKLLNLPVNSLHYMCKYEFKGNAVEALKAETALAKVGLPKEIMNKVSEAYEEGMNFTEIADFLETTYLSEYAEVA